MSRFIPVGGSLNFRHLGGYETASGRKTRGDRMFRGGWFELADGADLARFESTGIRHIFDFRSERERLRRPLGEQIRARAEIIKLGISPGSMGPYLQGLAGMAPEDIDCKAAMIDMHYGMLAEGAPQFGAFLRRLMDTPDPFMIMCSTGKDRTGVASALLLTALGVSRETIFEDYLISADVYRGREIDFARNHGLEALGVDLTLLRDVFTVHAEYLEAVWRRIGEQSGDVDRYLRDVLQLSEADLKPLREHLTA